MSPLRCPFCLDVVEAERARVCPDCGGTQHPACSLVHGGCVTCAPRSATPPPAPRDRPSEVLTRERGRERDATKTAFGLGLAALVAGLCGLAWTWFLLPRTFGPYPSGATMIVLLLGGVSVFAGLAMAALAGRQALRAYASGRIVRLCLEAEAARARREGVDFRREEGPLRLQSKPVAQQDR